MERLLVALAIVALVTGCSGNSSSENSGTVSGISTPASVSVVTPTND